METDASRAADEANLQLLELYRAPIEEWRLLRKDIRTLSIPMFLKVDPAYFSARRRIIFVGQETHGWWRNCPISEDVLKVEDVMTFYQSDWINDYRTKDWSPYFAAVRRITTGVGLKPFPQAVLTSNLFPCDANRGQAPESVLKAMRKWRLLPGELKILKPDFVVFFAGPTYAYNLEPYFGRKVEPGISSANPLQSYRAPGETWSAWVTYHPKQLQLRHQTVIDQIIQAIRTAESSA